ncbi:RNA polymerase sigma factor [Eggerthella timonensis]|uniref:RNA polymerase sigma factor n=1 Tax=Eggerthella timonensis TaxID=1871008 RepID=UPI000C75E710|nr:sigma-70 family RNA polymerase sigma factor [Eggerthella timonensis]
MRKRQPENEAERLVRTYADLILRLSYTYLKSTHDAEDICQNVLIKLLQGGRAFESAEHERAWVVRTTANACKDVLRSGRRRTSVALEAAAGAAAPEAPDSDVLNAVMALPQAYREAVYLHYYEGYTAREIAQMTDRTEDAVAAHLSRGRAKLRAALEGADDDR